MVIRLRELNYFFFLLLFSMGLFSCMKTEQRPNIIYILADDLGYGELGVYGQELLIWRLEIYHSPKKEYH